MARRSMRSAWVVAGLALLATVGAVFAADWPHFLGPDYDTTLAVEDFDPTGITEVWSRPVNTGCSSVTIVDGRIYTMGNDQGREFVYCMDPETGNEIWTFEYACDLRPQVYEGGPSSTPTVVDGRVYTVSKNGHIYCLDAVTGGEVWSASAAEWKPEGAWWGFSDSAIVWGDKVFFNIGTRGLALDKATGDVVWSSDDTAASYCSLRPLPEGNGLVDGAALVVQSCKTVDVVAAATGESLLGELPDWAKRESNCNGVTPVVHDGGLLVMHSGHGLSKVSPRDGQWVEDWFCADLKYDDRGWFTFNRQVIRDGYLFTVAGAGGGKSSRLACVDLSTGKVISQEPFGFGNLILTGDVLISLSEDGEVRWGKLDGAVYSEVHKSKPLNGGKGADKDGPYWSHPVLHEGRLYARSNKGKLTCFRFD